MEWRTPRKCHTQRIHPGNGKRKNAFRYEYNKRTENVIKEHEMVVKIIFKNSAVKNARA